MDRIDALFAALAAYRTDVPDDASLPALLDAIGAQFDAALDDDLNISEALAALFDGVRELNRRLDARTLSTADAERATAFLRGLDEVLAIASPVAAPLSAELEAMLAQRVDARARRDWAESDRLRDALLALGISVEDTRDGQRWRHLVASGG